VKKAYADAKSILLLGDYKLQILSLKLTSDYRVFLPCSSTASVFSHLVYLLSIDPCTSASGNEERERN